MAQFKLGSMIILKILGMAMLCEGYKSYSKNIPNDARNMNRGSNITHRSLNLFIRNSNTTQNSNSTAAGFSKVRNYSTEGPAVYSTRLRTNDYKSLQAGTVRTKGDNQANPNFSHHSRVHFARRGQEHPSKPILKAFYCELDMLNSYIAQGVMKQLLAQFGLLEQAGWT